jgi:hypothetical protein
MAHTPDTYAIISTNDLPNIDFSQIGETSAETIRYNLAGTQFGIKWFHGETPTFITDGTVVPLQTLNHSQAIALMRSAEWQEQEPAR